MSSNESSLVPFGLEGSQIRVYTGEKGLYNLVLGSRRPEAKRFKRWVTNENLDACGLQVRNQRGEWELTDAGRRWGEAPPYCRQEQSGYQIMWNPAVVAVMRELG
jgi:hypothetical protein